MGKIIRQMLDGQRIIADSIEFKVAVRAAGALGAVALSGIILFWPTGDTIEPSPPPTYSSRSFPTFELPHSDDGPNATDPTFSMNEFTTTSSMP